jgi:MFS family permease
MPQHHRVYFMQFAVALALGALLSRLPDLQREFALTESRLGLLLVAMSSGVLTGMTVAGPLVERVGARTTAFVSIFGAASFLAAIPWAPSALAATPYFFLAGLCISGFEINANIEADRREALLGYRIMSRAHGMWSAGFFLTALAGAAARQAGISIEAHMAAVLAVVLVSGLIVLPAVESAPKRPGSHDGDAHRIALPTLAMLPLCLVGAAPLLAEGAGVDWSAIYMRDVFAVEPFVGGLSVTIFSLTIAIGRLFMDSVVDRFGVRPVARTLLAIAAVGLVMVAAAPLPSVALVGFALAGLGASSVYPLAVSAAAQRTDRPAAVNVAALGQVSFVVFFVGPPLLGFVAEYAGIRWSYWVVVPLVLAAFATASALSPGGARPSTPAS